MKEATNAAFEQYNKKIASRKHRFLMHYKHADFSILSIKITVPINEAVQASSKFLTSSILYKIRTHTDHIPDNYNIFITERSHGCIEWLARRHNEKLYNYNMHLLVQIPCDSPTHVSQNAVAPTPKGPSQQPK